MLTPLIVLIVLGSVALAWSGARAAAELAAAYGREACARAGVQWLDHSVMLTRIALRRAADGRLRIWRQYRFEYSEQGEQAEADQQQEGREHGKRDSAEDADHVGTYAGPRNARGRFG